MRSSVLAACVLAVGTLLGGCQAHINDDEVVSQTVGADFFGAGGMLNVTEPVAGDALLAGGHVAVASEVKGDLIVAGGEVSVAGNLGDDLYAAGGNVKLDAIVAGNARIAGGDVAVGPATVVHGALSLTGGNVDFDGDAHDYLQVSAGRIRINGTVQGDVTLRGEQIEIGTNTRIDGKLIVHSSKKPDVPAGAQIAGGVEFHAASPDQYFDEQTEQVRAVAHGVGSVLWFVGVFLAGSLYLFAFPVFSSRAARFIGESPLPALGIGFAVLVCAPVVGLLLLITVIGIPLALLLVPMYLLLLFLGWVTIALFLGERGLALLKRAPPFGTGWRLLGFLVALGLLAALGAVPVVGGWLTFIALVLGVGALVCCAWTGRARTVQAII